MVAKNAFKKTKKPLSIAEFELSSVMGLPVGRFSPSDTAERFDWNLSIVHDCWEQWSKDGTASRRPGSGRPRGAFEREDRRIRHTAEMHKTASAEEIRAAVWYHSGTMNF
ncbi:uncharacterized protein TNCV_3749461 [Trichonephila clavipes]|nr:uncharacterized protein TNCV_3749461 [Trichonephila clavipes]